MTYRKGGRRDEVRHRVTNDQLVTHQSLPGGPKLLQIGDARIQYRARPSEAVEMVPNRRCTSCNKKLAAANRNLDDLCFACQ